MNPFYTLLLFIAIASTTPIQSPLLSGEQLDWSNADCSSSTDNNTVCIQEVFNPVADPDIFPIVVQTHFCGYIQVNNDANPTKLFFWLVLSERNPATDPVVLWTNGGPGSSSVAYGLFSQWGPYLVERLSPAPGVRFKSNPNRLTKTMSWIFLEHPTNTGYCKGDPIIKTSAEDAKLVVTFIDNFFMKTKFKFQGKDLSLMGRDFHLAGESFAGHYLPAIGSELVNTKKAKKYKLKSIMIGNGCMDWSLQGEAITKLLCGPSGGLALKSSPGKTPPPNTRKDRCANMAGWGSTCDATLKQCRNEKDEAQKQLYCIQVLKDCRPVIGWGWADAFATDVYDATRDMNYKTQLDEYYKGPFADFMNVPSRRAAYGVGPGKNWEPGSRTAYLPFITSGDFFSNSVPGLKPILAANIDVMIYAGDQDLACSETLTRLQTFKTEWAQAAKWKACESIGEINYNRLSLPGAAPYASYIRAGKLNYVRVFQAGHMINENKAPEGEDLINRWVFNRASFAECTPPP